MRQTPRVFVLALAFALAPAGRAEEPRPGFDGDFKLRLGGFAEGERDLGRGDADTTGEAYADAQALLYWRSRGDWAAFSRLQGFAPSGELVVTDEDRPRASESYAAVRELWLEYRGITSYPGELLRLGLQRLRDADGLWLDRDIESLRWIFDTTLLQGQLGVAESSRTWRSDDSTPSASLRDRTYAFAGLGRQWTEGHFVGSRVVHAFDHIDVDEELRSTEPDPKRSDRRYTWVNFYAHDGYYDPAARPGWSYTLDASLLSGDREDFRAATLTDPELRNEVDVSAWAADAGLRWRAATKLPWQVGLGYAHGSGARAGETGERYEQTGLHSNRSRFTGTRSALHRYGEALQPDLSNLQIATAFVSIPAQRWDASLIYHHYTLDRASQGVITDGVDVQPYNASSDLGQGLDLAVAYYFANPAVAGRAASIGVPQQDDDVRSNLRLRAGAFQPGNAYAASADDQYRVTLELTLWF